MSESNWKEFEIGRHWLSKRSDTGYYYIYWYDPRACRNRRKTTGTSDLERAKLELAAFIQEHVKPPDQIPEEVPICAAFSYYLTTWMTPERVSRKDAERSIRKLCEFCDHEDVQFVSELTWEIQSVYMDQRRKQDGVSDETISRDLSVLKAALNWYYKRGRLKSVPHIRSLPKAPPRKRFLSSDEAQRLLQACEESHLKLFVLMCLNTLARPGAILDLRTTQVDLEAGFIDFLPLGKQQSNKRRPIVPITRTLASPLAQAVAASESGHIIEYLGQPVQSVKRAFRMARRRAELSDDVVPYTLRHTGATWLASKGVDLREIAGMMGHSQQKTTELYAKHHPSFMGGAKSALDDIFDGFCADTVPMPVHNFSLDSE